MVIDMGKARARLHAAMEKYSTLDDVEEIRGVPAGGSSPSRVERNDLPSIEPLDDPEANRIFREFVEGYIENGGEPSPSPAILEILKIGAELRVFREKRLRQMLENA